MKLTAYIFAAVATIAVCMSAVRASNVVTLNPITFNTVVGIASTPAFVGFYNDKNCLQCSKMDAELEKVGEYFKGDKVTIAKFNCGRLSGFCTFYGVSDYPTFKYFDSSERRGTPYTGDIKASALITFVEEKLATASTEAPESSPETENLVGHMASGAEVRPGEEREEEKATDATAAPQEQQREEMAAAMGAGEEGTLEEKPSGRVPELDKLAEEFMSGGDRESIIDEARKSEEKNGRFYVKYMELIAKKGDGYVEMEKARLERIIADVKAPRLGEFVARRNIIDAFKKKDSNN